MSSEDSTILISVIDDRIRRVARQVIDEQRTSEPRPDLSSDAEARKLSETVRRIMAKEFVSIKEVALLLNCSDGHVRNLVGKAMKGQASNPIPFRDLDGVTVFPRCELLEWAKQPKRNLRAVS